MTSSYNNVMPAPYLYNSVMTYRQVCRGPQLHRFGTKAEHWHFCKWRPPRRAPSDAAKSTRQWA